MKHLTTQELINYTLATFRAEQDGDLQSNLDILDHDFAMSDMVMGRDAPFLRYEGEEMRELMKEAFVIKGREYVFETVVADQAQQKVIVEFIESYPSPITGEVYVTPQIAICVFKNGKLWRTRHYMDPSLSRAGLTVDVIKAQFS